MHKQYVLLLERKSYKSRKASRKTMCSCTLPLRPCLPTPDTLSISFAPSEKTSAVFFSTAIGADPGNQTCWRKCARFTGTTSTQPPGSASCSKRYLMKRGTLRCCFFTDTPIPILTWTPLSCRSSRPMRKALSASFRSLQEIIGGRCFLPRSAFQAALVFQRARC